MMPTLHNPHGLQRPLSRQIPDRRQPADRTRPPSRQVMGTRTSIGNHDAMDAIYRVRRQTEMEVRSGRFSRSWPTLPSHQREPSRAQPGPATPRHARSYYLTAFQPARACGTATCSSAVSNHAVLPVRTPRTITTLAAVHERGRPILQAYINAISARAQLIPYTVTCVAEGPQFVEPRCNRRNNGPSERALLTRTTAAAASSHAAGCVLYGLCYSRKKYWSADKCPLRWPM